MEIGLNIEVSPLNDPDVWLKAPAYEGPLSDESLAQVQREVDAILGVTQDGKSIAKIVWNGDKRYWKEFFDDWDVYGHPIGGLKKRPWVLYKTIVNDNGDFVRDAFVPRYIVLTRLEPEQYAATWAKTSRFYCPERKRWVAYKPEQPPAEMFLWFKTISNHRLRCCQVAAGNDVDCHGYYVSPRAFTPEAREIRRGMEASDIPEGSPFDSPDAVATRVRERMTNNYAAQAMRKYLTKASFLLDEAPLTVVSDKLIEEGASAAKVRDEARERIMRGMDSLEKELKRTGAI